MHNLINNIYEIIPAKIKTKIQQQKYNKQIILSMRQKESRKEQNRARRDMEDRFNSFVAGLDVAEKELDIKEKAKRSLTDPLDGHLNLH